MPTSARLAPGATLDPLDLTAVTGSPIAVPDPDRLVHLQFRRFAGCPVCNLHLRSVAVRHDEIAAAGIREVAVFHSPAEELRQYAAGLPFALIGDPDKRLYTRFGVESARRALLDPRVVPTIVRAVARSAVRIALRRDQPPARKPHGGRIGLPADFLVDSTGRLAAAKYGEHAYDQWSVDELLALARQARPAAGDAR